MLTAQTTAFTAEQKLANIAEQRMVSSVGLVKALGSGWDVAQMDQETGSMAAPIAASALTQQAAVHAVRRSALGGHSAKVSSTVFSSV